MEKVLLIDYDGRVPNLALMRLSTYYKELGCQVHLNTCEKPDLVFCSVLFSWNKEAALKLKAIYPNIEYGGTGFDIEKKLPPEVEKCKPDYNLYTAGNIYNRLRGVSTRAKRMAKAHKLISSACGKSSEGCIRKCPFCIVPRKEGEFRHVAEIGDLVRLNSDTLILLDNNLTCDPNVLGKLQEVRERGLTLDICQGVDVRLINEEIAQALAQIKHLRSLHFAWDLMAFEKQVMQGIDILTQFMRPKKLMCFILCGFNTSHEEDFYRVRKLIERGINPLVMIYNNQRTPQLRHFARCVNARIYTVCGWDEYAPWVKYQRERESQVPAMFGGAPA